MIHDNVLFDGIRAEEFDTFIVINPGKGVKFVVQEFETSNTSKKHLPLEFYTILALTLLHLCVVFTLHLRIRRIH
jgi:hypothetical protein